MDPFIGQIMQVGFNFAPANWSTCAGQTVSIPQNTALFSLLGTSFGGNGTTTFNLPNMQGRVGVGTGTSPTGTTYVAGQVGGAEHLTLTLAQMPAHTHTAAFSPVGGPITATMSVSHKTATEAGAGAGDLLCRAGGGATIYVPAAQGDTLTAIGGLSVTGGLTGGTVAVGAAGSSQPVSVLQPYLAVTTIIAIAGIFPSRG